MEPATLTLLSKTHYPRHGSARPSDPAISQMLIAMIRVHTDEDDFVGRLDELEAEEARYHSLDELAPEHLFDELTFLACGSECYGYTVYTLGDSVPELVVVRMDGSNSGGATFAVGDPETIVLIDDDMMFDGHRELPDPALKARVQELIRGA
jgi:hypothetical protein